MAINNTCSIFFSRALTILKKINTFIFLDLLERMSIPNPNPPLKDIGSGVGKHLHPTIHKSEVGMLACSNNRGGSREMVTISVKIQANHETHHVKVYMFIDLYSVFILHKIPQMKMKSEIT